MDYLVTWELLLVRTRKANGQAQFRTCNTREQTDNSPANLCEDFQIDGS